ncbi:MAG: PIN domain-containing protein [Bryobacteraceae bacterium]
MTFVDTSAIYALLDRDDDQHARAGRCWFELLDSESPMFTTNYVVVECCALAQSRLGLEAVRAIEDDLLPVLDVVWVDEPVHRLAITAMLAARRRKLSLVDCVSFTVMRRLGLTRAFAFDDHFAEEGFSFPS